jgi:Domain of unknown function (DUF4184)
MALACGRAPRPALLPAAIALPYSFAHPAAAIPLARLLGPRAVPSALAIGSVIPDAWYLVPLVERDLSHSVLGALWFCVPAGLAAYAALHLIFKQPMLALLPRRVACRAAAWSAPGLPAAGWLWVLLSLLCGIATHLAWDAFTHAGHLTFVQARVFGGVRLYRVLQHASTLLGGLFLGWWLWRKLRSTPPVPEPPALDVVTRIAVLGAMALVPAVAFAGMLIGMEFSQWRAGLRASGVTALSSFGLVALSFCLLWRISPRLRARPRPRARACAIARPE